jgi:hypothetical protein
MRVVRSAVNKKQSTRTIFMRVDRERHTAGCIGGAAAPRADHSAARADAVA